MMAKRLDVGARWGVDDAWYLYDLEALVRTPRGEAGRTPRDEGDKQVPEKGRAE